MSTSIEFSVAGTTSTLQLSDQVFRPNLTTSLLGQAVEIRPSDRVLELGCGVGPLAIYAAKQGAAEVYAVDIMEEACALARHNAEVNGVAETVHVRQGNLFEPLEVLQFDLIINDVSAMAEEVARISPWYPLPIPSGGDDGTVATIAMLREVKNYLRPAGRLYFPLISLSDSAKVLREAEKIFGDHITALVEKNVPFCEEFKNALPELERLRDCGKIAFSRQRSHHLWNLRIFRGNKLT